MGFRVSVLLSLFLVPTLVVAQHVEIGVFGNYSRQDLPNAAQNLFGLGGRADLNVSRIIQLEAEAAYDFKYPHVVVSTLPNTAIINTTKLGVLHANAGLKFQTPGGSFFGFIKGGVNKYDTETMVQTVNAIPAGIVTVQFPDSSFCKGVLYPGAGIGFHAGPLGIRLDAGDEIIWINGAAHNSLRITFGPTFRF
jgi:hypothetical protein